MKRYLLDQEAWDEQRDQALHEECSEEVDAAVDAYLNIEPRPPETMFDNLYETLPGIYQSQREEIKAKAKSDE